MILHTVSSARRKSARIDSIELSAAAPETTPDVEVALTLSAVSVIEGFEDPETIGTVTVTIAEPSEPSEQ